MDQNAIIIAQLEHAAKILKSSECLDKESRENAEKVFIEFRKMKTSYKLFQLILETTNNDFVLFSTVGSMINTISHDWTFSDLNEIVSLRSYLMNYIICKQLSSFLIERFVLLIAIIVKIESIQDNGIGCRQIIVDVLQLLQYNDEYKEIVCCKFISSLLVQYSLKNTSNKIELASEQHKKVKSQFETNNLKDIFQFFLRYADSKIKSEHLCNESLQFHIISVIYDTLIWQFEQCDNSINYYISIYEVDSNENLYTKNICTTNNYNEILFDPNFLPFMFSLCDYYHKTEHYVIAYDCLYSMTTLKCKKLPDDQYITYYQRYIENFITLITQREIDYKLALCSSRIISNLVYNLNVEWYKKLPNTLLDQFLFAFTSFTCKIIECAFLEEMNLDENDSEYFNDSLDNCFSGWSSIIDRKDVLNQNILKQSYSEIFTLYYKHHLKKPEGIRPNSMNNENIEINEFEDSDRYVYHDQLQIIGYMSIVLSIIELPINYITQIIDDRTNKLHNYFTNCSTNLTNLDDIFDDLNWSLLISGHIVNQSSEGYHYIPHEILNYSDERLKANNTNIDVTIGYLKQIVSTSNSGFVCDTITDSRCDPIVKLFYSIIRLAIVENLILSSQNAAFFSPEVSGIIVWFFNRFIRNYYSNRTKSIIYESCFIKDTEILSLFVDFILTKIEINIIYCNAEINVIRDTMDLFMSICSMENLAPYIIKSKVYKRLIEIGDKIDANKLSKEALQGLFSALIAATSALTKNNEHDIFIRRILNNHLTQLSIILNSENNVNFQTSNIEKNQIVAILDVLNGTIANLNNPSCGFSVFCILNDYVFEQMKALMIKYRSKDQIIVKNILEVYKQCSITILNLTTCDKENIFYNSYRIIEIYFKIQNCSNLTLETYDDNNEDSDCLFIILKITINLITLDEYPNTHDILKSQLFWNTVNNFLPLMQIDSSTILLNKVAKKFCKLLSYANQFKNLHVEELPPDSLTKLFRIIELGLNCESVEIQTYFCSFIQYLANFKIINNTNQYIINLLKPILGTILRLIFNRSIKVTNLSDLSNCLLALIVLIPNEFQNIAETFVNAQQTDVHKQRLYSAFEKLLKDFIFEISYSNYSLFFNRFKQFITDIQAFLFVH